MGERVVTARWPEADRYKADLLAAIGEQRKQFSGRLDVGGTWAGPKTLHLDVRLRPFIDWLSSGIIPDNWHRSITQDLVMWGLVMEIGDKIQTHSHVLRSDGTPNGWAGVYYVNLPPKSGRFYLAGEDNYTRFHLSQFIEGDAIVFSADTRHGVTKNMAESRTSISWSAR